MGKSETPKLDCPCAYCWTGGEYGSKCMLTDWPCTRQHVDELECHCNFFKTGGEHEGDCDFARFER